MSGTTEWNAGIVKAATWGVPALIDDGTLGGGLLLKFMSESMGGGIPEVIKDENVGEPMSGATFQGNISVEGTMVFAARYESMCFLTAMFMGQDTYTVFDTTLGTHDQVFQNSNTGFFSTLVMNKEFGTLWEYQTVKISQIELSHTDGKLTITPTFVGNKVDRATAVVHHVGDDHVNEVIARSPTDMILFNHMLVALTEVTGSEAALDFSDPSTDIVVLSDLKVVANRNVTGDHTSGSDSPAVEGDAIPGAGEIDEPETDGMPEGTVEITFANHDAFVDGLILEAQTRQPGSIPKVYKLHAKWEGRAHPNATIPPKGTKFHAEFCALTVADAPVNASGAGAKVPVTITFDIVTPTVLPSGDMAWADTIGQKPFKFFYQNAVQVSELA